MTFADPIQWVVITAFLVVVLIVIAYILLRVIRTFNKADKYFDNKEKGSQPSLNRESNQPSA